MAPIRVGIIGLSKAAKTSWAGSAHLPYLIASNGKYEIKALCNSSKESAQKAIDGFNLPSSTKAYGNPQDLANDPEIDLVVCSTRVDTHYKTIKPSIEAGKDVLVEWPLASSVQEAEELVSLAKDKGVKTMVGLQGRVSPVYLKAKDLIQSGKIGKVLSSSMTLSGGTNSRDSTGEGLAYFFDKSVGGNIISIFLGHTADSIANVLGPIKLASSNLSLLRPDIKVLSSSGDVLRNIKSDVPDLVHIEASLPSHNKAPIAILLRRAPHFKGTPALIWTVQGQSGEIRVESAGAMIHAFDSGAKILVENFESGEVETATWEDPMAEKEINGPARNIGALYEAFAGGEKVAWPTFEDALERHRMLDEVWGDWKA